MSTAAMMSVSSAKPLNGGVKTFSSSSKKITTRSPHNHGVTSASGQHDAHLNRVLIARPWGHITPAANSSSRRNSCVADTVSVVTDTAAGPIIRHEPLVYKFDDKGHCTVVDRWGEVVQCIKTPEAKNGVGFGEFFVQTVKLARPATEATTVVRAVREVTRDAAEDFEAEPEEQAKFSEFMNNVSAVMRFAIHGKPKEYAAPVPVSAMAQSYIDAFGKKATTAAAVPSGLKPVPWRNDAVGVAASATSGVVSGATTRSSAPTEKVRAAFFDLDGTIAKSNIVMQYVVARLEDMPTWVKLLWVPFYALKCILYLAVDKVNRSAFNKLFVSDFKGLGASKQAKVAMASLIHKKYLVHRVFPAAATAIAALKRDDFRVILVTGSLDFIIAPLAASLNVDHVIANILEEDEETETFTGRLVGPAVADEEKRVRVLKYARDNNIDLMRSQAFGDSVADLPMLECVGEPHAVSPSKALRCLAEERGWPVLGWKEDYLELRGKNAMGKAKAQNTGTDTGSPVAAR